MASNFRLYNSLTRRVEPFAIKDGRVKMYVCGLTVYDKMHIGHALSALVFDVLARWLRASGAQVTVVSNFTDIDERIIARAAAEGVDYSVISARYIENVRESSRRLNIAPPDQTPLATENIQAIVDMTAEIIARGMAYEAGGSVYFSVKSYVEQGGDYGALSGRTAAADGAEAQAANETAETEAESAAASEKRAEQDFVLWRAAKPGEPAWDSPWGEGRPGWHIECSAMLRKYVGETCDIHGGGLDLIFPHHENELAQSKAAHDMQQPVRFWAHNGLLKLPDDVKMSKSLGNSLFVDEILQRYSAAAVRIWMLQSHYRAPLKMNEAAIAATERSCQHIQNALTLSKPASAAASAEAGAPPAELDPAPYWERFAAALDNDLNTPVALAEIFSLSRAIAKAADFAAAKKTLQKMCAVLGLDFTAAPPPNAAAAKKAEANTAGARITEAEIEQKLAERTQARQNRQFAAADQIRADLLKAGIQIEDTPTGTKWHRA